MAQITIYQALEKIDAGAYVMPAFQRDFVWGIAQIEKLWDSILCDYPISNFLFWHIDENNVSEDTNFCHFLKEVVFNNARKPKSANYELSGIKFDKTNIAVLDGQQRLTSLYLSLLGDVIVLEKHARKSDRGIRSRLIIELNEQKLDLEENGYNSKKHGIYFTDRMGDLSPTQFEIKSLLRPEFQEESSRQLAFEKIIELVPNDSKEYARNLLNKLYNKIFIDTLVHYTELDGMKQDDALEVFVRFNSGGIALSKSEISMSILDAYWPNSKAKFGEVLRSGSPYEGFGTDFIMRTALMLYGNVAKSNINKTVATTLKNDWDNFMQTLNKLVDLLSTMQIDVRRFVSSWNVLLPIIYAIHYNPAYQQNRDGIQIYLFRAILFTYFQSGTTAKLSTLKSKLDEYERKFNVSWLDSEIRPLELTEAKIEDILNSQKKDRVAGEALYYLNRGWIKQIFRYELDHLHPRTRFDRVEPDYVSKEDWIKWRQNRDKLPNLWPLVGRDNGSKNDMSLTDYYNEQTPEQQVVFRKQALIPDNVSFAIEDFGTFYQERKKILREKLYELLGGQAPQA